MQRGNRPHSPKANVALALLDKLQHLLQNFKSTYSILDLYPYPQLSAP